MTILNCLSRIKKRSISIQEHSILKELNVIKGQPPTITEKITGCMFHPRCIYKKEICDKQEPPCVLKEKNHSVCCYLY